jgi:hypothetical protein
MCFCSTNRPIENVLFKSTLKIHLEFPYHLNGQITRIFQNWLMFNDVHINNNTFVNVALTNSISFLEVINVLLIEIQYYQNHIQ